MAIDETLLQAAIDHHECAVRWYRWSVPTISLGYFQSLAACHADATWTSLPIVRRLSGGGAILHDQELTYSCVLAAEHPFARTPSGLYALIHEVLISALVERGIPVAVRGQTSPELNTAFLCFGRGDAQDVVLAGFKVLGSAQRRRKGAVLQHGSLVLEKSPLTPQFPGVFDLAPPRFDLDEFQIETAAKIAACLDLQWQSAALRPDELMFARSRAAQHVFPGLTG